MTEPADPGSRPAGHVQGAAAVSADGLAARSAEAGFPAEPASASRARAFVVSLCHDWGVPGVQDEAEITVTELVENAVQHAQSTCDVAVTLADHSLTIAVGDQAPAPPVLQHPRPDQPGGRGLLLIDGICRRWGYEQAGGGKRVWAVLTVGSDAAAMETTRR